MFRLKKRLEKKREFFSKFYLFGLGSKMTIKISKEKTIQFFKEIHKFLKSS